MILLCGIASEPPVALAIEAARLRAIPHLVFHQRDSQFCDIAIDHQAGRLTGSLWAQEREWPLEQFTGVYSRMIPAEDLPENRQAGRTQRDPGRVARSFFLNQALADWIELAECRVVNRANAISSNVSKPYQTQIIAQLFPTPATLVTNEPVEARDFIRSHQRVIYKSISSIRSIVREWSSSDEQNLDKIRALPTQFQSFISGTNVRVHVVGRKVFATEISSPAVDYRYAQMDGMNVVMRPIELPADVSRKCRDLSTMLQLPFCGIDLKRTERDVYYCFEVNPSPAYSYYQDQTGQPIAEALVDYLAGTSEEGNDACSGS
jgi:glutathione synthase/RimK-type ligase-like ATP-grasp enzyme